MKKNESTNLEVEVLPKLTKKQKKQNKLVAEAKEHDYQVANIATAASDLVGKKTNGIGAFAAYVGVHAIDFLLGADSEDFSSNKKKKKKKKKKKNNKQDKDINNGNG